MNAPLKAQPTVPSASRSEQGDFDPRVVDALIATVRGLEREHGDVMLHLADAAGENDYFATQRLLRRTVEGPRL